MRKTGFLFLTLTSLFIFTSSCSSDDGGSNSDDSTVLLKKMILTSDDEDADSYWNSIVNFSYNGTKLVQAIDENGYKSVYHYTGDLITKIEYFNGTILESQDLFSYNSNGKLIEYRYLELEDDWENKFVYVHNSDSSISYSEYQGEIDNTMLTSTGVYYFTNGELTSDSHSINSSYAYSYDSKNNPFKNVTGFQEIMLPEFIDDYMVAFGRNKMLTSHYDSADNSQAVSATHTYNSKDYPTSSVINADFIDSLGYIGTVSVQYFYE